MIQYILLQNYLTLLKISFLYVAPRVLRFRQDIYDLLTLYTAIHADFVFLILQSHRTPHR